MSDGTRDELVRAITVLAAREGLQAATTAAIAREAGVAEGTLYRHFRGKEALAIEAFRRVKRGMYEAVTRSYDVSLPLPERFRHLWLAAFRRYREDPEAFRYGKRFMESPYAAVEGGEAHEPMVGLLSRLRRDGVGAGLVKDLPEELLIALFYAPISQMLYAELNGGHRWSDDELEAAAGAGWDSWSA
jgi:AcrR family transcriptional regulator